MADVTGIGAYGLCATSNNLFTYPLVYVFTCSVFERTHEPCVPTFSALKTSPDPSEGGENKLAGPGM